ncbi:class I SAM-dependent methyltransferase [Nocardioides sp.]|uniref:class I SAM-dependent methyltransferase n=1 Tax=Nocardioides sp. TaxID=35761 RepID=UPI002D7E6E2F|nr:class I SAM-dependent methyltransferase [Nocardioides sp.]HET8959461.1 class I SAM-dependent methyltransferase [Nocardioides sp.]
MSTLDSAPDRSRLLSTASFGGLAIAYDERVLAPRRWTTMQSYWAVELLRDAPPGRVLELCSGAGHIGLLTVALVPRDLVMVDVDPHACELARRNATANQLLASVDVRQGDLQDVIRADEGFVGVIADPPWVPSAGIDRFPEDPELAIDGGEDGLAVAWSCLEVMDRHLAPGGWGILQLGTEEQAERVAARCAARGLGLELLETRVYDRGVLVRLAATG